MTKIKIKNLLTDIRFWILILFLLRLIGIMNAPLEVGHNWRQALTNMIARNFLENRANIFFPTIDMAGENTGIIGSEFPFFNYLIYLNSAVFGYSHWCGRLINLVVSSLGLLFFYKLAKNLVNSQTAFSATIVLGVSIWFAFSRKIMPDTFSVSLVIIGLYYAYNYLKQELLSDLVLFFAFSTVGILCKIPALSLFSLLAIVIFIKEIKVRRKVILYVTGTLSLLIVCLWYFYWVPYLLATYHYQLYFPKEMGEGIKEIIPLLPELLEKFYFSALCSYIAFTCTVMGFVLLVKAKKTYLVSGIGIITVAFMVFIIKTGAVFPLHNYYIIPFSPVMALMAGYAISQIPLKLQYAVLGLIAVEAIANQQHDFRIKDSQFYKLELENIIENTISNSNMILINGGQSPQDIYFANRKGWTLSNSDIVNTQYVDSLINLGADYLILDKTQIRHEFTQHEQVYSNDHYSIYRLEE